MKELCGISPYVYHWGRTQRSTQKLPYTVSSENCNVFIFCVHGSCIHEVDGRKRLLTKGTAEVVPPFSHQIIQIPDNHETEIFYLYFDLFEKRNIQKGNAKPIRNDIPTEELYFMDKPSYKDLHSQYEDITELIKRMEATLADFSDIAALERKTIMMQLLLIFLAANTIDPAEDRASTHVHVARAMRYIERHCNEVSLCAKTTASFIGLDETYLSRLFSRCIHMSLSKYIRHTRISHAKELFILKKQVSEVARLCGFTSVQSFCRTFRQIEGITPTEYIQRIA